MKKFTIVSYLFSVLFVFQVLLLKADGSRQSSPGTVGNPPANGTGLFIGAEPGLGYGPYRGAPADQSLQFTILDATNENLYFGFQPRTYGQNANALRNNVYYRILDPNGVEVVAPTLIPVATANGFIEDYDEAITGPNIANATPAGYDPIVFDPAIAGDYSIELYPSNDGGATTATDVADRVQLSFYDLTVSDVNNNQVDGRIWCRKWSFTTVDLSTGGYENLFTTSFTGSYFGYTPDAFVVQVQFQEGFRPLGYELALNFTGATEGADFRVSRQSIAGGLNITNGYQVFLTDPDIAAFPPATPGTTSFTSNIFGCPGSYYIPYNISQPGDVSLLLDLDGTPGYQEGTEDRILEDFTIPAGNNVLPWDGLDGLGNAVLSTATIQITSTLYQGRTNFPMNDVELNVNGFSIISIVPNLGNKALFWDDTNLGGVSSGNLYTGVAGPAHAWNGPNPTEAVPAPANGGGDATPTDASDDFGNNRVINTWFYAVETPSPAVAFDMPDCDIDADGVDDFTDLDDDNDGIPDLDENGGLDANLDTDGDGVFDYIDTDAPGFVDADGNGVDDRFDFDGDGIINSFDLDSDGDGILDLIENQQADANTDGQVDSFTDVNGNGLSDDVDPACDGSTPTISGNAASQTNTSVGTPDNALNAPDATNALFNDNGDELILRLDDIVDAGEDIVITSADLACGTADLIVEQSVDGIAFTNSQTFAQTNALADYTYSVTGANATYIRITTTLGAGCGFLGGTASTFNIDALAYNYVASAVICGGTIGTAIVPTNTDGTAGADYLDIDSDDDGIVDNIESQTSTGYTAPLGTDADFDGVDDSYDTSSGFGAEGTTPTNTDGLDNPDYTDTDSDNDGINDIVEGWDTNGDNIADTTPAGADADNDGLDDAFDNDDTALDATNGQVPTDFPNEIITTTPELDWREDNNRPPITVANTETIAEDAPTYTTQNLTGNDTDPDGGALTANGFTSISGTGATIVDKGDGTIDYTPATDFNGIDTIVFSVCDPTPLCTPDTLFMTVTPVIDTDGDDIPDFADLDDDNDGILDVNEEDCSAINSGNSVVTTGDFASEIFWLSWTGSALADGIDEADTVTIALPDGGTITAAFSNVEDLNITESATYGADNGNGPSDYYVSDFNTFGGALLQTDYNLAGASLFANFNGVGDNNDIRFDVAFTAVSADGITYTPDIIFADAEETNNAANPNEEFHRIQTNGGAWELIESVAGTAYNISGVNTNTVEYNNTGAGVPILRSVDVSSITVTVNAAGQVTQGGQGFAFGVFLECVPVDTDNDGIANHLDLDSDNDGCPDATEAGHGIAEKGVDTVAAPYGANGFADTLETSEDGIPTYVLDTNSSGVYAFIDSNYNSCAELLALTDSVMVNEDDTLRFYPITNDTSLTSVIDSTSIDTIAGGGPQNGTFSVNSTTGEITYIPNANFFGFDTLTYTVCDTGLPVVCDTATIIITVLPVKDTISINTPEDSSIVICDTLLNGITADSVSVCGNGNYGTSTIAGTCITYEPNTDYIGNDTTCYIVCNDGTCDTTIVLIAVGPGNVDSLPLTTPEDSALTICSDTLIGGSIPDSISLGDCGGDNSNVTVDNMSNCFTYTPTPDYVGNDTICLVACNDGICDTTFVPITVTPVNDPPIGTDVGGLGNEDITVGEDSPATISPDLLANNDDVDGDTLTVTPLSSTGGGTLLSESDSTISYTPATDFEGIDSVIYSVCDPSGACINDTLFVEVTPVNDPPIGTDVGGLGNENITVGEDAPATISPDLLANNDDVDGDTLTVTPLSSTGGGTLLSESDSTISYTPATDFEGIDSVIYSVCDPSGACINDTLFVEVTPVNDPPIGTDVGGLGNENITVGEDSPTTISPDLLANNDDVDGDTLTVTPLSSTGGGTLLSESDSTISYTPATDFEGIDSVIYSVCDPSGACINDTLFVEVTPVNDLPIGTDVGGLGNENITVGEDSPTTISPDLLANNDDVDGDTLTVTPLSSTGGGTLLSESDSTISYTPATDFEGIDSVIYSVCDPSGACINDTLFVEVTPVNDPPIGTDVGGLGNENITVGEDSPTTISPDLLANNDDVDGDTLTVTPLSSTGGGTLLSESDSTISYTPATDFEGIDSVIYSVCDPSGACINDTLFVEVTPVNDPPIGTDVGGLGNENITVAEDAPATISPDLLANNDDVDGDTLTVTPLSSTGGGTLLSESDSTISYTPAADFEGIDSVIYSVCDPSGLCINDTLFVEVTPVNDAPTGTGVGESGNEMVNSTPSVPVVGEDLLANNTDVDGDVLAVNFVNGLIGSAGGTFTDNGDGTVDYTSVDPAFEGVDTLVYDVCDNGSPVLCVSDSIFVNVTSNSAPIGTDVGGLGNENITVVEDSPTTISPDLLANNDDVDGDTLTVTPLSSTGGGTLLSESDSTISYTPAANFEGIDSVIYSVCDPAGLCINDTLFVEVTPVNDPPIGTDVGGLGNENITVAEDSPTTISPDLLANNDDVDGDTLTVTPLSSTGGGTLLSESDSTISYTPATDFEGIDSVIYSVCDPSGACINDTLFVEVTPVNDSPIGTDVGGLGNENITVVEDSPATISPDLLANNDDVDGDTLTVTPLSSTGGGTLLSESDSTISYTPATDFEGIDSVIYSVCDPSGACINDTLFVEVTPVNDAPTGTGVGESGNEMVNSTPSVPVVGEDLLANNTDVDGDVLAVNFVNGLTGSAGGTFTDNGDGTVDYTSVDPAFEGVDTLVYDVCDNGSPVLCVSDSIFVNVTSNSAPIGTDVGGLGNENITVVEDSPTTISPDLLANNDDVDGDALTVTPVSNTGGGTLLSESDSTISYTPSTIFIGIDSVIYSVCDPAGLCINDTLFVTVTSDKDTLPKTTPKDSVLTICSDELIGTRADSISVGDCTTPTGSVVETPGTDCFEYTPVSGFVGEDSLCLVVCNDGICDTTFVIVSVIPSLDTLERTVDEDDSLLVCATDLIGSATTDSLIVLSDGSIGSTDTSSTNSNCLVYTPGPDVVGIDTLTYVACNGSVCDTNIVIVNIIPVEDVIPVDVPEDSLPFVICAPELPVSGTTDSVTVSMCTSEPGGTADIVNDCIEYSPSTNFVGVDTLCYISCNDGICDTNKVIVSIVPDKDTLPKTTPKDSVLTICSDELIGTGADSISVGDCTTPTGSVVETQGTDCFEYTPVSGFVGEDSLCLVACNDGICDTTFVIVSVIPSLDTLERTVDEDDSLFVCATDLIGSATTDSLIVLSDGSIGSTDTSSTNSNCLVYTPGPDVVGIDTLTYVACNGSVCDTNIVIVNIIPVEDVIPVDVPEDSLPFVICAPELPVSGTTDSVRVSMCTSEPGGTADVVNGCIEYSPSTNFVGVDTLCYISCNDGICDTSKVIVSIVPDKDTLPKTTPKDSVLTICSDELIGTGADNITVGDCTTPTGSVLPTPGTDCFEYTPASGFVGEDSLCLVVCNDSICDTTLVIVSVIPSLDTLPRTVDEDDSLLVCATDLIGSATTDSLIVLSDGSIGSTDTSSTNSNCLVYTPGPDVVGIDTLTYVACNGSVCDTNIVIVNIIPVEDVIPVDVPEDSLPFVICAPELPVSGTTDSVRVSMCTSEPGGTADIVNGCIEYSPSTNFVGVDTLCYISCNDGICDTSKVIVSIVPDKDTLPKTTPKDSVLTICSDELIGTGADSISVGDCTTPTGSVLETSGTDCFEYTPVSGFVGEDSLCLVACNDGICDTTFVIVSVIPDTLPLTTPEGESLTICPEELTGNANPESISAQCDGNNGATEIVDGCFVYTPNDNYVGNDTLCYEVCDNGVCNTVSIILTVSPPKTTIISDTIPEGEVFEICGSDLLGGADVDSAFAYCSGDNGVTDTDPIDNCFIYTPDEDYTGTDTLCYVVCNDGVCDTTIVNLYIMPESKLKPYKGFSPDESDNVNPTYVIEGIEDYPNASLRVINRWGSEVYISENGYDNDWDGTSNSSTSTSILGQRLPVGTYFYILDLGEEDETGTQVYTGYIYLQR